ncbi:alpha/beta fold hydrolase [Amphibiibacter pelophylacis]|uniref:Alpha/beta hydrolase n=1 Tax=Amphibiibacter pelophylacis TaxID=1799477 RepID=A0ACC6NYI1_9BURK
MSALNIVLVHGAWHTGAEMEPTAALLRQAGHTVLCPTLAGNRPQDDRASTGLEDAAQSLCEALEASGLDNIRLVGHSYGGMVISRAADLMPQRLARLVYVNAFVPQPGECLNDMVPPHYVAMFDPMAQASGGAVMLPFPVWREAFINDGDMALAQSAFAVLNPQPYKTFTDSITLSQPMAACPIGKSYINCRMDTALPQALGWHPRLSERLGLFRYVECSGSHEVWFSDPAAIARAIEVAARD